MGPMARGDLRDRYRPGRAAVAAGATVLLRRWIPARTWTGSTTPPTVLGDITPTMALTVEEVFGPVATIITVTDRHEEAVAVANDTPFGLGASVWSADVRRRRWRSGGASPPAPCFINALVVSYVRMPFGGTKR